jgi:mono/diheme cytochrome c family protein
MSAWHGALLALAVGATITGARSVAAAPDATLGKQVYEKANCVGCHKWHGGGGGGYGGAALSLRATQLDTEQMREVVRCGRPGTGMPYHGREAYKDDSCYGMTKVDLGADAPPKAATFLRAEEIEAVVEYVAASIKGKGEPSYEDCIAFWGKGERQCDAMR